MSADGLRPACLTPCSLPPCAPILPPPRHRGSGSALSQSAQADRRHLHMHQFAPGLSAHGTPVRDCCVRAPCAGGGQHAGELVPRRPQPAGGGGEGGRGGAEGRGQRAGHHNIALACVAAAGEAWCHGHGRSGWLHRLACSCCPYARATCCVATCCVGWLRDGGGGWPIILCIKCIIRLHQPHTLAPTHSCCIRLIVLDRA